MIGKRTVIIGVLVLAIGIAGGALYSAGNAARKPLAASDRQVLAVQDKRLTKGNDSAPVKIVEYADILCPYCAKANQDVIPPIQTQYIDRKLAHYEVRLVAMIAPDSERAAEGAYCAAEQNKFWQYLDTAYKDTWTDYYSQNKSPQDVTLFSDRNIHSFASRVGLNVLSWQQCMDNGGYAKVIASNQNKMSELKAYGTPHFIINGNGYNGAPPFASFKAVIDAELNRTKAAS